MPVFLMREHELYPIVSKNRTVISIPSDSSLEDRPLQKIKMMVSQHSEPETPAERILSSIRNAIRHSRKDKRRRVYLRLRDQEDLRLLTPEDWDEILEQSEDFTSDNNKSEVIFILPDSYELPVSEKLTEEISEWLETPVFPDYLISEKPSMLQEPEHKTVPGNLSENDLEKEDMADLLPSISFSAQSRPDIYPEFSASKTQELDFDDLDLDFHDLEDGFSARLLRLIDESQKSDAEIYKKANVDRRLFSKIRSNPNYHPAKKTVLAFAIALGLDLDETEELLQSAGYAFYPASRADRIIQYCIDRGIFDVMRVNQILFHFDQPLIGS
ncbi:hypothetical protein AAK979_06255 [Ileibacterium valens]|uniref:hypothetical protein n=1 Tax=Ileibacterium valens TaxID=1862668 RepID=UPI0035110A65